jgi:Major capsid protein N-terminus/Large eukaryotic DNA virus major capsid protein
MKVFNHVTGETKDVQGVKNAGDLKPDGTYTLYYERMVLDDKFPLSSISNTNAVLDLWVTKPKMGQSVLYRTGNIANVTSGPSPSPSPSPIPENIPVSQFDLRELGTDVPLNEEPQKTLKPSPAFATVAKMGVDAIGPQDEYSIEPVWTSKILQHTKFTVTQKKEFFQAAPPYVGSMLKIQLNPRQSGDLLSNMFLVCEVPPNISYCRDLGRALLRKVELYLNDQLIDWYDDDWSIIHDEIFLTASERLVLDKVINGTKLIIPLKLFFCKKGSWLPLCALHNQLVYINIYFNPQSWFTDYTGTWDIKKPYLLFDQVFLTQDERMHYMNTEHNLVIPTIYRETPIKFTKGTVSVNMSPNYNIAMISWFIRNFNYENNENEYKNRYSYGYVSDLVQSNTTFTNWRGDTAKYVQTIDVVDIFINNFNIIKGMQGDSYFKYTQNIEHGLSIPDKDIFSYCFSENPNDFKQRGEINFKDFPSKTTNMSVTFMSSLVDELKESYSMYVYYYGYSILSIKNGYGVVSY